MSARRLAAVALAVACAACTKDDDAPVQKDADVGTTTTATLAIDIRGSIDVTMSEVDGALDVELAARDMDFAGFFAPGEKLRLKGTVEAFPESNLTLYTGVASLGVRASSPCGSTPVVLALALSRRGTNARLGGGLTAYCGDRAVGVPKRVFRISGSSS